MEQQHLNILSLNTRGIRNQHKRNNLFYWLNLKNINIAFLQETYLTNELTQKIEKEWGGESVLAFGTEHSRGSAVLFNKSLNFDLIDKHVSEDSRIILINVNIKDAPLTLVNIYAPNQPSERKTFFNKLTKWIKKIQQRYK